MKKVILMLIIVTICLLNCFNVFAGNFDDVSGHWAEEAIIKWSDYGVINGYNGKFMPDDELTRAQMATILSSLLGLNQKANNIYADVSDDAWYADAILKCTKANILSGDGKNANPDKPITREEAMVMIGRALKMNDEYTLSRKANDMFDISDWARGYVYALYNNGYVNGVGNDMIMPGANITRASIIKIFDNMISQYIISPGEYQISNPVGYVVARCGDITIKSTEKNINLVIIDEYKYKFIHTTDSSTNTSVSSSSTNTSFGGNGSSTNTSSGGNGSSTNTSVGENGSSNNTIQNKKYSVKFYNINNEIIDEVEVKENDSVLPPNVSLPDRYLFTGWDKDISKITNNISTKPLYTSLKDMDNVFCGESLYCRVGEEFEIAFSLKGNVNLCAFDIGITYDPGAIEFLGITDEDDDTMINHVDSESTIKLNFMNNKNVTGEFDMCVLKFKAISQVNPTVLKIDIKDIVKLEENKEFVKPNFYTENANIFILNNIQR